MRLRHFAVKTVEAYIYAMEELCRFYMRPLETLTCHEVQLFLDEIITVRKRAWATVKRLLQPPLSCGRWCLERGRGCLA